MSAMSAMSLYPHAALPSPWAEALATDWAQDPIPPVLWSVAGTDSGGAAGLSADTRAAVAMGVHLCPVVAAVTAQNSVGVQAVFALPAAQIRSQLQALAADLPPRVIKTGLLASVAAVEAVAEMVDQLRAAQGELGLVVDPVLGATAGGAAFADAALLTAYRTLLLPRATLITPNRREAERLLDAAPGALRVPALAAALRARFPDAAVCITGGDDAAAGKLALDWWDGASTTGWLALPRLATRHHHGSGCTFATAAAAALARGFSGPEAAVLAKMLGWCALRDGHAAGAGAGPLRPTHRFIDDPAALPLASFGDEAPAADWPALLRGEWPAARFEPGLYAITDDPARVAALAASGRFAQIQLRIKHGDEAQLGAAVRQALAGMGAQGDRLWINDHAALALAEGATGLHLGQEDWAALTPVQRARLRAQVAHGRLRLGVSSHSLWELARARGLAPNYIACGPIWSTTTKAMPWQPQGLAQLRWWVRMAGRPVVAIGGILGAEQIAQANASGAAGVCLVRGLEGQA